MAFLQTIDPFVQPLARRAALPTPYTIDPFVQSLTAEVVPVPPSPAFRGGGGGARVFLPYLRCPAGLVWNPDLCRCVPVPVQVPPAPVPPTPRDPTDPVTAHEARTVAFAIALTVDPPEGYEVLAAEIALEIAKDEDED